MQPATVLLIESESRLGRIIAWELLAQGWSLTRFAAPEDMEQKIADLVPDVVIFNTGLPVDRKSEFYRSWRELSPRTRFVEVSENLIATVGAGDTVDKYSYADEYVEIPFRLEFLVECVRSLLPADADGLQPA